MVNVDLDVVKVVFVDYGLVVISYEIGVLNVDDCVVFICGDDVVFNYMCIEFCIIWVEIIY